MVNQTDRDLLFPWWMATVALAMLSVYKTQPMQQSQTQFCAYLRQKVSQGPSHQRCHGLGDEGLLVESIIVCSPTWNGTSSDSISVTKEGTGGGDRFLGELSLDETGAHLFDHGGSARVDAKGADGQKRGRDDEKGR